MSNLLRLSFQVPGDKNLKHEIRTAVRFARPEIKII